MHDNHGNTLSMSLFRHTNLILKYVSDYSRSRYSLSNSRLILGVWLIERSSGKNLISLTFTDVEIDMDLFAPFLSATKFLIDTASSESLEMINTEGRRYVWHSNDWFLIVLAISKRARVAHMRFLLNYALNEFMNKAIPSNTSVDEFLRKWDGTPRPFREYEDFLRVLIDQFEQTDESLLAGKAMDCLAVYSHIFTAILRTNMKDDTREKLVSRIREELGNLIKDDSAFKGILIDKRGIDVLSINPTMCSYKVLRTRLDQILEIVSNIAKDLIPKRDYNKMLLEQLIPYMKRDIDRLETYSILDDIIRLVF